MHKKPKGYTVFMPFAIALQGVHRAACSDTYKTHDVTRLELEHLLCVQYALQLGARDMLGVTQIGKLSYRAGTRSKMAYFQKILDQLVVKHCLKTESLGKRGTLYGLQPLGEEVLRFYQRALYSRLKLDAHNEKVQVKYKYYTLEELPSSAWDKGIGR